MKHWNAKILLFSIRAHPIEPGWARKPGCARIWIRAHLKKYGCARGTSVVKKFFPPWFFIIITDILYIFLNSYYIAADFNLYLALFHNLCCSRGYQPLIHSCRHINSIGYITNHLLGNNIAMQIWKQVGIKVGIAIADLNFLWLYIKTCYLIKINESDWNI